MAKLLLIDDEARVGAALRFALGPHGDDIVQEQTAAAGVERARALRPDCILVDVDLGAGGSGLEVCRQLKGDPETATIPVIMLSGLVDPGSTARGLEAGADDYVAKPFTSHELRARISSHIRRGGG